MRQGIDFLGYIVFPYYWLVRTKTKNRILKKYLDRVREYDDGLITAESLNQSRQSYLGILRHAKGYKIEKVFMK